jgi:hypothetical protein
VEDKWPIDGVYITPDLPFDAASLLQFMTHLGHHQFLAVLDTTNSEALVGDSLLQKLINLHGTPSFQEYTFGCNHDLGIFLPCGG